MMPWIEARSKTQCFGFAGTHHGGFPKRIHRNNNLSEVRFFLFSLNTPAFQNEESIIKYGREFFSTNFYIVSRVGVWLFLEL
jgi:hypothetical protein